MPRTTRAQVYAQVRWRREDIRALGMTLDAGEALAVRDLTSGSGLNQVSQAYWAADTVNAVSVKDYDLTSIAVSIFGNSIARGNSLIRAVFLINDSAETLLLGGSTWYKPFSASTTQLRVPPGGHALLANPAAGWAVINNTQDVLRVSNPGAGVAAYRLVLVGNYGSDFPDLPSADQYLCSVHGPTSGFSPTYGVDPANWASSMDYNGPWVAWRSPFNDVLIRPPQSQAELVSGNSTGAGTYTLKQFLEFILDRKDTYYPAMPTAFYLAGGYIFAPQYVYNGYPLLSVYPQGHVFWTAAYGFTGGAPGFSVTNQAIASFANAGGFVQLNFASPVTIPLGSVLQISGTSQPSYNAVCNVTNGAVGGGGYVSSGGGDVTNFVITDLPWVGTASGGVCSGGGRKVIDYTSDSFWNLYETDALTIIDRSSADHPRPSIIYLDENAHPQVSPTVEPWGVHVGRLSSLKSKLHTRKKRLVPNVTWALHSASPILSSSNAGTGGRLRVLLTHRTTLKVGDTVTVSGHSVGTANVTAAIFAAPSRYITLDTTATGGGTGGKLVNNSIQTQDLDQTLAGMDGMSFEGTWTIDVRSRALTESLFANLRYLLDNGFAFIDIAQSRVQTCAIASTEDDGGNVRYNITGGHGLTHGARIGIYGHPVSAYNAITYIKQVDDNQQWFTTEQTYSAGGTGNAVYTDLGRLVKVNSIDNTGAGGVKRLHCATSHYIWPQEGFPSIQLWGPAGWGGISGADFTPLAVAGQAAKVDLSGSTGTLSTSDVGYLIDMTGCRRFFAGVLMAIFKPGDKLSEDHGYFASDRNFNTWPTRLGAPSADAVFTFTGGPFERCTLIERTFANGSLSIDPQQGFVTVTIGGTPE